MSLCSPALTTLPWLPRRKIVDALLDDLGFAKVVVLRAVCGWFNHEILDAIMARKLVCVREGYNYSNGDFQFDIPRPVMAKLLLYRLRSATHDEVPHLYAIDRVAQTLHKLCQPQIEIPDDTVTEALLAAAIFNLAPWIAPQMMIPESQIHDQSSDDACHTLAAAAFLGQLNIVASLTRKGVDIETNSVYFGFPLRAAAEQGHFNVVRFLLEHGAHVSNEGGYASCCRTEDTALKAASRRGDNNIVRLLLDPKYGLQTAGAAYDDAILAAVYRGHSDLAIYLLQKCKSADLKGLQVEMFMKACDVGNVHVVQTLLDKEVDVNSRGRCNEYGLTRAAQNGHVQVVCLLLERGAGFHWTYGDIGALSLAAKYGREEVVKVLLDNGANVNAESGSGFGNPLREAAKNQHVNIMRLLLERGADIECERCGVEALDDAITWGVEGVIPVLVKAGVPIDGTDYDGEPAFPAPILVALMYGQYRVVNLLTDLGAKWVDPLTSDWAKGFRDGTYPQKIDKPLPLLKA